MLGNCDDQSCVHGVRDLLSSAELAHVKKDSDFYADVFVMLCDHHLVSREIFQFCFPRDPSLMV